MIRKCPGQVEKEVMNYTMVMVRGMETKQENRRTRRGRMSRKGRKSWDMTRRRHREKVQRGIATCLWGGRVARKVVGEV